MPHLIIGDTTATTARIWVRGDRRHRRCDVTITAATAPEDDGGRGRAHVDLPRDKDYTGTVDFADLRAGTYYKVRAAFAPGPAAVAEGSFRTLDRPPGGRPLSFSFVLSSCNLPVVRVNNLIAYLLALLGFYVAKSSLDLPRERWRYAILSWLRAPCGWIIWLAAAFIKTGPVGKQPGRPYLRSPFVKLSAMFDSVIVTIEAIDRRPQVGDPVHTPDARGVIAAFASDVRGAAGRGASPPAGQLVLTQVEGTFRPSSTLTLDDPGDEPRTRVIGQIVAVEDGRSWYHRPAFFLHAGDQIYYDFPFEDVRPDRGQYGIAYREAWFDDAAARHVMANWPHYMTLDDHEVADQFATDFSPPSRSSAESYRLEATAAYRDYVSARHPLVDGPAAPERRDSGPFWYHFTTGGARFFVLDTRTRRVDHGPRGGEMLDETQLRALLEWLASAPDDVKFVVTSVPFVAEINEDTKQERPDWFAPTGGHPSPPRPARKNPTNDTWSAERFREQRSAIVEHIHANRIERVVFLTGDLHCCYHATMRIGTGSKYDRIIVHELAAGPLNQLQLADSAEFKSLHAGVTTGDLPYEIVLDRFHSGVSAVMHLRVVFAAREEIPSGPAIVPEIEWSVIRTLTDVSASDWPRVDPTHPGPEPGEPTMAGRITFVRQRTPDELRRW